MNTEWSNTVVLFFYYHSGASYMITLRASCGVCIVIGPVCVCICVWVGLLQR